MIMCPSFSTGEDARYKLATLLFANTDSMSSKTSLRDLINYWYCICTGDSHVCLQIHAAMSHRRGLALIHSALASNIRRFHERAE